MANQYLDEGLALGASTEVADDHVSLQALKTIVATRHGSLSKANAIVTLTSWLAREDVGALEQARLAEAYWRITGEESWRDKAAKRFRDLYLAHPRWMYQVRHFELTGE